MYWKKLALLAGLVVGAGCNSCGQYRGAEYGPAPVADAQGGMVPSEEKSFVERHPLLSAPRHYYRDSSDYFVVKVLAATVVGVPVGVARESWQIVYGQ